VGTAVGAQLCQLLVRHFARRKIGRAELANEPSHANLSMRRLG
jgi:hypothetical protein